MKINLTFLMSLLFVQLFACNENDKVEQKRNDYDTLRANMMKIKITIGNNFFSATLDNNPAATAFERKLPMTINMVELNGNEKYFDLAFSLLANASNPGIIKNGDLMLYGSNTLVLFYKTFSTSYRYTKLGQIDNPAELADALGSGNMTITFELGKS